MVFKCSVLGCDNIFVNGQASGFFRIPIIRENERDFSKIRNRSGEMLLFTFVQSGVSVEEIFRWDHLFFMTQNYLLYSSNIVIKT